MNRLWTLIWQDHQQIWQLLERLTGGGGEPCNSPRERRLIRRRLVALQSAHEVAEERVVWPAVRQHCPRGDELVDCALEQEAEGKWALNELRRVSPGSEEFDDCVHTVAGLTRTHVSYEQNQIWPRLTDHLSSDQFDDLTRRWLRARAAGPTRPHPHTPARPAVLATAGSVLARLDRARDLFVPQRPNGS
jgi:Hemerythrin HHE cation binding domain